MSNINILQNMKVRQVADATASGSSNVVSSIVDMSGYENVTFVTSIATASSSDNYIKIQGGSVNSTSSLSDLTGTKVVPGASGDTLAVEIVKPLQRYIQATLVVGATTALDPIIAIQSGNAKGEVDNNVDSSIVSEVHVSPAVGTA